MYKLLRVALCATLMFVIAGAAGTSIAAAQSTDAGNVRYVKRTGPSFDRFTSNPASEFPAWMRQRFWRSEVSTPYFDEKTRWYGQGWIYRDLYAIYPDRVTNADWILKDARGNRLYIPWGCENGTCPQFAGDPGDASFRRWWIDGAKEALRHGYKGIWLDDVNMNFQVGNGNGDRVAPIDRRTGAPMTYENWRRYIAEFVEQIRAELPNAELLHNSIWYAVEGPRDNDPYVKRQIAASDFINLERGFNDDGLTGGTGVWSLDAVHRFVDRVHAAGKSVVIDDFDNSLRGKEYALANYFLINGATDGLGSGDATPESWWGMWDAKLGAPRGDRYGWQGLIRRDFAGGIALVNEPEAPRRTIKLSQPMIDSSGRTVTTVTLGPKQGAVLRGVNLTNDRPTTTTETVLSSPRSTVVETDAAPEAAAPAAEPTPAGAPAKAKGTTPAKGTGEARTELAGPRTRVVVVSGRVLRASGGRVQLTLQRKVGKKWQSRRGPVATLDAKGRFSVKVSGLPAGTYRARARFLGHDGARRSVSAVKTFRVREAA